jgi:hypothetical protein
MEFQCVAFVILYYNNNILCALRFVFKFIAIGNRTIIFMIVKKLEF